MTALVVAGLAALLLGGLLSAAPDRLPSGFLLQATGALALGLAGAWALGTGDSWGAPFSNELTPQAGIDGLTGFFLATIALVACPALVFASSYAARTAAGRATGVLTAAFILSLIGVVCARDALSFLFCWELMTLVPAVIILVGQSTEAARHTVFAYVAITHLGGAGTWIALLLLGREGAIGDSTALTEGSGIQAVIAVAAIVGFGTKAGLMPMHVWLPRAHPIAPAYISALMSGVMVAVAAYGLVRVLIDWLGSPPSWVGAAMLALGGLSALGGITYALFQRDLKRLLAYSTVEHLGIVALGLGACLVLRRHGADQWAAFALGAALLHTLNHAAFKALLFLGAGTFERATGSLGLDQLGGLLRRLPWSGGAFLVGALAIAGMPLLNGFASEWLTLQALVRVPAYAGVWDGMLGAIALAALAATMALAVLCFVKVIGLVLLGPPRRTACAEAVEPPVAMRSALSSSPLPASCSEPCLDCCSPAWPAWRHGPSGAASQRKRASTCLAPEPSPRSGSSSRSAASAGSSGSRGAAGEPLRARPGPAASRSNHRSSQRVPASRSRFGSCSRQCCAHRGRSRRQRVAVSSRRCRMPAACRT